MGRGNPTPLRALPRAFVVGVPDPAPEVIELPQAEADKFRKVLRLSSGDEVAVLPGDGRLIRCELQGLSAIPAATERPETESPVHLTVAVGLPKPEKLEEAVRLGAEMGASAFAVFPSQRSVVQWDDKKRASRLARLETIAREACEVSFRTRLPSITFLGGLDEVLTRWPEAVVLSESEGLPRPFEPMGDRVVVVIGPEGGWAKPELARIGDRAVTLGPRVLRVDTAVAAACALALLSSRT